MSKTTIRVLGVLAILISGPLVLVIYHPSFILLHPYLQDVLIGTGLALAPIGGWMLLTPVEEPDEDEGAAHGHGH
jgi:hypothetical protein